MCLVHKEHVTLLRAVGIVKIAPQIYNGIKRVVIITDHYVTVFGKLQLKLVGADPVFRGSLLHGLNGKLALLFHQLRDRLPTLSVKILGA